MTSSSMVVSGEAFERIYGRTGARLVQLIAQEAQSADIPLYLVGGCVRDLLLDRPSLDLDFVVERGDAANFASAVQQRFGGRLHRFPAFGTARWDLDAQTASALNGDAALLPDHIDFATARRETYEYPAALPKVFPSSLKHDLFRRDFTINALAITLSPVSAFGMIVDEFGGLDDLYAGRLRVLHTRSFMDDPTRLLRLVRFETRLNFQLESGTAALIPAALPVLHVVSGERVAHEIELLLAHEDMPERYLVRLHELGVLTAIHPQFVLDERVMPAFQALRSAHEDWALPNEQPAILYWHGIACLLEPTAAEAVLVGRLHLGEARGKNAVKTSQMFAEHDLLNDPTLKPSAAARLLANLSRTTLCALWALSEPTARNYIRQYAEHWQHITPITNGKRLISLGIPPSPCYGKLITRLRDARIDGEVTTDGEELRLLHDLIERGYCHERP